MGKSGRHKRGKPGHGGHQGGSKRQYPGGGRRRGGGSGRGPEIVSDDDGPGGTLHIGGVVVRVDGAGNGVAQLAGHRQQRRRGSAGSLLAPMPPLRRQSCSSASYASGSGDGSSSDGKEGRLGDEAMEDYLANLGAGSSGHSSDGTASHSSGSQADVEGARSAGTGSAAKRRRQAYEQYEVLRRFSGFEMGDEGPPENLGWPGEELNTPVGAACRQACGGLHVCRQPKLCGCALQATIHPLPPASTPRDAPAPAPRVDSTRSVQHTAPIPRLYSLSCPLFGLPTPRLQLRRAGRQQQQRRLWVH